MKETDPVFRTYHAHRRPRKLVLAGITEGRRGRGRPREKYMTVHCPLYRGEPKLISLAKAGQSHEEDSGQKNVEEQKRLRPGGHGLTMMTNVS